VAARHLAAWLAKAWLTLSAKNKSIESWRQWRARSISARNKISWRSAMQRIRIKYFVSASRRCGEAYPSAGESVAWRQHEMAAMAAALNIWRRQHRGVAWRHHRPSSAAAGGWRWRLSESLGIIRRRTHHQRQ